MAHPVTSGPRKERSPDPLLGETENRGFTRVVRTTERELKSQRIALSRLKSCLPTIAESGLRGFDVNPWWGVLAPAGIDMRIVRKINADVADILKTRDMQDFFKSQGAEPLITSPEEFQKMLVSDAAKWAKVVKASGARID